MHVLVRLKSSSALVAAALLGTRLLAQNAVSPPATQTQPAANTRTAPSRGPVGLSPRMLAELARQGRVRVVVGLAVRFAPEGVLDATGRAEQRAEIGAAQDLVLMSLAGMQVTGVTRFRIIPAMAMEVDEPALQALALHPNVAYIEPDDLAAPSLAESAAIIGAPTAWSNGHTGSGQTVAILDTGVDRIHPFLGGRVVSEACFSTTSTDSRSVCTAGTGTGSAAPCGVSGCNHGTHVAGIAAGGGTSFSGVAPGATIIAVQVFSRFDRADICSPNPSPCVLSYTSDQLSAMQFVYDLRGSFNIAALNLSLGGGGFTTQAECDAQNSSRKAMVDTLRAAGIATVAASGNNGFTNALSAPACISTAVSVGSTTDGSFAADAMPADRVSFFSNSASFLNLLAPGHYITSSVPGGGFATFAGTSMAAPQVTGAWAVLKSRMPSANVPQVLNALTATGTGVVNPGNGFTQPRINVFAALNALANTTCGYAISPTSASVPATGGTRTVTVTAQPGCLWTATSDAAFVAITSGASGAGSGTVTYAVSTNFSATPRTGTITIQALRHTVMQAERASTEVDFNGDGHADLLWHHQTSGQIGAWLMNGTTLLAGTMLSPPQVSDTNWKVVGAGDLDADGQADLVWQNIADGRLAAWLMNSVTVRRGELFSTSVLDLQWRIRSVADMDGDGHADLVWQHEGNGSLGVWLMNGLTVVDARLLDAPRVVDTNWRLVGTADFDGNGSRDLVWQHQIDGRIGVWHMNGLSMIGGFDTNPARVPDTNWKIRAVVDLNGDGHPDLVWQHVTDGRISAWLMNGLPRTSDTALTPPQISDTNWHIVGPR